MLRSQYQWLLIGSVFTVTFWTAYLFVLFFNAQLTTTVMANLLITNTPAARELNSGSSSVLFVGDVLLSRKVEYYMKTQGPLYPFTYVESLFKNHEAVVINFEAAVPAVHKPTPYFNTQFSVAATMLPILSEVGITHASLANNHSEDFGRADYLHTQEILRANNITPFGDPSFSTSSSVTILKLGSYRIGLIGIHTVFTNPNQPELKRELADLAQQTDIQIAYVHWGTEYVNYHSPTQANFASTLVASGIDAIIGHHPHVTQDIQMVHGVPVFYSLGNFIFDQYFSTAVQEGYTLALSVKDQTLVFDVIPVSSFANQSQPRVMPDVAKQTYLTKLAARSDQSMSQNIKQGKLIVPFSLATSSKTSIISQ